MAQIAPEADLVMANAPGLNPVTFSGIDQAYSALVDQSITIVNQSFQAGTPGVQGIIENDLARSRGVFVTQAAGNGAGVAGVQSQACRDNANALCVGAHGFELQPSCFSSWENAPGGGGVLMGDREEPDMLSFGGDGGGNEPCSGVEDQAVEVAGTQHTQDTALVHGTSYSAPAAAASAALLREYCWRNGKSVSDRGLRSILMLGAMRNSRDYRYSTAKGTTPGGSTDWRDGAGVLSLASTLWICSPDGEDGNGGWGGYGETFINTGDGEPFPEVDPQFQPPDFPPQLTAPLAQNVPAGPGDGRLTKTLVELGPLPMFRVRAVVSWNICRISPSATTYRAIPDFDVFLYNRTKKFVYFSSQSFDDNNEGFDVDLAAYPGNEDGDEFDLILGWLPSGSQIACSDSPAGENVTWAAAILPP